MAIISLQEVSLGFGGPLLLENINLQIERGESIGLLGRNGAGKSTLLKLLNGDIAPDSGSLARQQNLKAAYLSQEVPLGLAGTVNQIVAQGLAQQARNPEQPWQAQLQVEQILSRMQLDPSAQFEVLSAGLKRRVLLARQLVGSPDLLLLDEPTNHLDIPSQEILEQVLESYQGTILLVTHDRYLVDALATQIWEIEQTGEGSSQLDVFNGTYSQRREERERLAGLAAAEGEGPRVKETISRQKNAKEDRKKRAQLQELENKIATLEARLSVIGNQLENPPSDPAQVLKLGQEYNAIQHEMDEKLNHWEGLQT